MSTKPGAASSQPPLADHLKDSAQQIWLAGLGAFNKAQEEGSRMFDALVQEGLALQRKAQSGAEEKFREASDKMNTMAHELGHRATGQWDRLEGLFEERVARAMQRLGLPSAAQIAALTERLAALEQQLGQRPSVKKSASPKAATKTAARPAAKKKAAPARKPVRKAAR